LTLLNSDFLTSPNPTLTLPFPLRSGEGRAGVGMGEVGTARQI
jgi:hypothetical protein